MAVQSLVGTEQRGRRFQMGLSIVHAHMAAQIFKSHHANSMVKPTQALNWDLSGRQNVRKAAWSSMILYRYAKPPHVPYVCGEEIANWREAAGRQCAAHLMHARNIMNYNGP